MRVIFHIDLNAFFANAEISQHPELKGKPLVISHDAKRSVVSTASYEARALGIHSAMPLFLAKEKCHHLLIVEPHFDLYRHLSHEFFSIILSYSPYLEIASIDEGYVDMSQYIEKNHVQPYEVAKEIQMRVLQELKLPCSIGISPNKFLSKMASDMKKPLGITIITQSNLKEVLWPLSVDAMFGIGKKTAPKLKEAGIQTIGDMAQYKNYQTLRQILGRHALIYYHKANGKDDSKVVYEDTDMKSIGHSTTFQDDIEDEESLKEKFKEMSLMVAERAQKYDMIGNNISITLKHDLTHTMNRQMNIDHYTNSFEDIYSYALILFQRHYDHQPLRLIGITLNNVKRKGEALQQISLFDKDKKIASESEAKKLIQAINKEEDLHLMLASDLLKKKKD